MCYTERQVAPAPVIPAPVIHAADTWSCPMCTLENTVASACIACDTAKPAPPPSPAAPLPSLSDDLPLLSQLAPGGKGQKETEKQRYQTHLAKVESYKKASPTESAAGGLPSATPPGAVPKWKPTKDSDWCSTLVHGPNAPAACPKSGTWNGWKCIRCGSFYEYPIGGCSNGCSWREWGWYVHFNNDVYKSFLLQTDVFFFNEKRVCVYHQRHS